MIPYYFAGGLYSTQEVVLFCSVAIAIAGVSVGVIVFLVKKLLIKLNKQHPDKHISLPKALLIGFLVVGVIIFLCLLPTIIKDRIWIHKQGACAKQVGYQSPADDQSGYATAESQAAYQACLFPNGIKIKVPN